MTAANIVVRYDVAAIQNARRIARDRELLRIRVVSYALAVTAAAVLAGVIFRR